MFTAVRSLRLPTADMSVTSQQCLWNWEFQTSMKQGQKSPPKKSISVHKIKNNGMFSINILYWVSALGSQPLPFNWVAVPVLETLMISSCVNGCSHGFVALCNWNSDPTVIHGCLHSSRSVPTGTVGKEGQGLKKTLTHCIFTKSTHASPRTQSTMIQYDRLMMCYQHEVWPQSHLLFILFHLNYLLLSNLPFNPKSLVYFSLLYFNTNLCTPGTLYFLLHSVSDDFLWMEEWSCHLFPGGNNTAQGPCPRINSLESSPQSQTNTRQTF